MAKRGIGATLRAWRRARGLSQRALAAAAGIDYVSIARIEAGKQDPGTKLLARLAEALQACVPDLFGAPHVEKGGKLMEQAQRGRKGKPPKTVYLDIGVMVNPDDGHIRIFSWGDTEFVTTVCDIPESKRGHPHLYGKLRAILKRKGKWPSEMEQGAKGSRQNKGGRRLA